MSPFFGLDGGAGWLESRADVSFGAQRNVNGSRGGLFQTANNQTFNPQQQMFLNEFRFAAAKSIRTSTIILATFNTIAAFATAVGILLDGYYRQKRNNRKFRFRYGVSRSRLLRARVGTDISMAADKMALPLSPRARYIRWCCHVASWCKESRLPQPSQPGWRSSWAPGVP